MGVRADDPDVDIRPWEHQPGEPARAYSILVEFLETKTLREAVARAQREMGDAASVRVPGHISRLAQKWQWRARRAAYLEHVAKREHALFEEMRLARRRRRIAQLDKLGGLFDAHLAKMQPEDLERTEPRHVVQEIARVHVLEREELLDRPEDRPRDRHGGDLGPLPSLDECIPKPSEDNE